MSKLIDLVKELIEHFKELKGYKDKYEEEKKKREELEAEINEAIGLIETALVEYEG